MSEKKGMRVVEEIPGDQDHVKALQDAFAPYFEDFLVVERTDKNE